MAYKNGDFKNYYCLTNKRTYWVLGYFGGGAINFSRLEEAAKDFSKESNVSLSTVYIDEVHRSRRFKRFKYLYSDQENQKPLHDSIDIENFFEWIED